MKKTTKRIIGFACAVLAVILLLVLTRTVFSPKQKTLRYFNAHKDTLMLEIAENERPSCSLDITFNYWDGEHPIMEYIVSSRGIVPASMYYGFFYSYDGTPVAFQNCGAPLAKKSDTEWEWHGKGDNHGYVEQIEGNWYYFEASF